MDINLATSLESKTCWRCTSLGLPPDGILPGEEHLVISLDNGHEDYSCVDCHDRLMEELEDQDENNT